MQLCNINSLAITHTNMLGWSRIAQHFECCSFHKWKETLVRDWIVYILLVCSFVQHWFIHSSPPDDHDASAHVCFCSTVKNRVGVKACVCMYASVCVLGWYRKVMVLLHYVLRYHYIIALASGGGGASGVQGDHGVWVWISVFPSLCPNCNLFLSLWHLFSSEPAVDKWVKKNSWGEAFKMFLNNCCLLLSLVGIYNSH